jgi:hypothetical protein
MYLCAAQQTEARDQQAIGKYPLIVNEHRYEVGERDERTTLKPRSL